MSKYTTEVRYICEEAAGLQESVGFDDIWNVLTDETVAKVFQNITFPLFDEAYRIPLEKKILLHYYTREIGFETVGLWKLKLTSRLNDIMPLYNQLYQSAKDATGIDFFNTADYKEVVGQQYDKTETMTKGAGKTTKHTGTDTSTRTPDLTTATTSENKGSIINADTPQSTIGNLETTTQNKIFASDFSKSKDNATSTEGITGTDKTENVYNSTVEEKGTGADSVNTKVNLDKKERTVVGRYGETAASLLKEMRSTFLNIDNMIIEELDDLFMLLW